MALQAVVSLLPHAYYLLRKFQPEVAFCQQGALRGIGLSPVFAGDVYHGVAYLRGPDALAAGEYDPFGSQADGSQVAWSQWKGKGMGAYLVEYAADELVVRHDVVHKVLCRVGELGKGLFYLYLFGKMHERTGTLQGGVPEGIQFVTFRTGGFNSLVGYFQAAVAVLHLPQGITEAKGKGGLCGHSTDGKQHAGSSRKKSPA